MFIKASRALWDQPSTTVFLPPHKKEKHNTHKKENHQNLYTFQLPSCLSSLHSQLRLVFLETSLLLLPLFLLLLLNIMMLVLFAVLFICGLLNSLFYFSPTKFLAWLLSLFPKSPPPPPPPQVGPSKNANKAELQMIFSTFDRNGDGFITKQELEESLENLGLFSSDKQVSAMIERFDSNRDGLIDLQEFCDLYESMMDQGGPDTERRDGAAGDDDLKEAFDVFDENGDGLISVEELRLVLSSLGLKKPGMGLEECGKMIAKVDVDGDGKVNFEEFKRMMSSGTLTPLS